MNSRSQYKVWSNEDPCYTPTHQHYSRKIVATGCGLHIWQSRLTWTPCGTIINLQYLTEFRFPSFNPKTLTFVTTHVYSGVTPTLMDPRTPILPSGVAQGLAVRNDITMYRIYNTLKCSQENVSKVPSWNALLSTDLTMKPRFYILTCIDSDLPLQPSISYQTIVA